MLKWTEKIEKKNEWQGLINFHITSSRMICRHGARVIKFVLNAKLFWFFLLTQKIPCRILHLELTFVHSVSLTFKHCWEFLHQTQMNTNFHMQWSRTFEQPRYSQFPYINQSLNIILWTNHPLMPHERQNYKKKCARFNWFSDESITHWLDHNTAIE